MRAPTQPPSLVRLFFLGWIFLTLTSGGTCGALEPLAADELPAALDALLDQHPTAQRTNVTLKVVDLVTGETLYDRGGGKLFTPASNLKIYTSAAALALLGPEYRWVTEVCVVAQENNPRDDAVIVLRGGGDPMLTYDDLRSMLEHVVKNKKLRTVKQVIVDNNAFAAPLKGPGWMWDDEPDYYNMSISALMIDFNVLNVVLDHEATDVGRILRPRLEPPTTYPALREFGPGLDDGQHPGLAHLGDGWDATRFPFEHDIWVNTAKPKNAKPPEKTGKPKTLRLTMHDPTRWIEGMAVQWFWDNGLLDERTPATAFERQNWRLYREINADQGLLNDVIALPYRGKPLAEAVKHFNKTSENAVGEMLLLEIGRQFGKAATWPEGARIISQWLTQDAGLEEGSFRLVDGSGLSRYNLICADSSVKLLTFMKTHRHFQHFFDSLPTYDLKLPDGEKFDGVPLAEFDAQRIHAKPGGMSGVSTISGYLQTLDGRWLAFSLLGNGHIGSAAPVRDLRNQVWLQLARYQPAPTPGATPETENAKTPADVETPAEIEVETPADAVE